MKLKIVVLMIVILLIPGTLLIPTIVTAAVDTAQVVIAKETRFVDQVTTLTGSALMALRKHNYIWIQP